MLRLFIAYQVVGDCRVPGDQRGRSRLETRSSLKDGVGSVRKSESIRCSRFVKLVREINDLDRWRMVIQELSRDQPRLASRLQKFGTRLES